MPKIKIGGLKETLSGIRITQMPDSTKIGTSNYEALDSGSRVRASNTLRSISNRDSEGDDSPPTVSVPGISFDDSSNCTMSEGSLCLGRNA